MTIIAIQPIRKPLGVSWNSGKLTARVSWNSTGA